MQTGVVPSGLNELSESETKKCNGKLVPIWKLELKLGDLEEVTRIKEEYGAERVHELQKGVEKWHNLDELSPERTEIRSDE